VKRDMITFLKVKFNFSEEEITDLLSDKEKLDKMFPEGKVADFIVDPNIWLKNIEPDKSIIERFLDIFRALIRDEKSHDDNFYIELALIIRNFRKTFE
jgi:hypothetical protein